MKKNSTIILFLTLTIGLLGCSETKKDHACKLRFANFLISSTSIDFDLEQMDGNHRFSEKLGYKQTGHYLQIPEGRYILSVSAGGNKVLSKEWVSGRNDVFTIAAIGILPGDPKLNEETWHNRLLEIFEGGVEESSNGGLPKLAVYLDHFEDKNENGELKIVHLVPGFAGIRVRLVSEEGEEHLAKLDYPQKSSTIPIRPGTYKLVIEHGTSGMHLGSKRIEVRSSILTTAFISGFAENYPDSLDCVVLDSPREG